MPQWNDYALENTKRSIPDPGTSEYFKLEMLKFIDKIVPEANQLELLQELIDINNSILKTFADIERKLKLIHNIAEN